MKRLLLSAAVMVSAFSMVIAAPVGETFKAKKIEPKFKTITADAPENVSVRQLAPGVTITSINGRKTLNILGERQSNTLELKSRKIQAKATLPKGYVLYESFEDWNGKTTSWKPTGWSVESKGTASKDEKWTMAKAEFPNPDCPDGNYFLSITEGTNQDEWFISPFVVPTEGMELSYWVYLNPLFLFIVDKDHVDFSKNEWIGNPEVAATLQIWAQVEGEKDWVMLRDYAEEYKGWTYADLVNARKEITELSRNKIEINDYYGKKMRIAFRYVGTDGGEIFLDAIAIGYPTIDDVAYGVPESTLYWGFIGSPYPYGPAEAIAIYPAYTPITWKNKNVDADVNYTWTSYYMPAEDTAQGEDVVTSDDPDEFTVIYKPQADSQIPGCSLYSSPQLHADGGQYYIPADYQASFSIIQAGGRPADLKAEDDVIYPLDLLPFNAQQLDIDGVMINENKLFGNFGGAAIPVFGYDGATSNLGNNTDQYWLKYQLNGEPQKEGDFVHLIGIGNLLMLQNDAPMVLHGANVYGFGQIWGDAQITMSVRAIVNGKADNFDYKTMAVIASKTITGGDILRQDSSKSALCLPFTFDEPVVLRTSDKDGEVGAYFITLEGFHTEQVSYFMPWQNELPMTDRLCLGYAIKHIDLTSHIGGEPYYEITPMDYMDNGRRISFDGAFAFGLIAEYPWLATDCEEINLPVDGSALEIALESYYDGSELTVEAPAGVKAAVSGQYDQCVLKVSLDSKANAVTGNIVVKGEGVELTIPVTSGAASIDDVITAGAEIKAVYDLTGRKVEPSEATPGVYVVKYADGATRKLVVK